LFETGIGALKVTHPVEFVEASSASDESLRVGASAETGAGFEGFLPDRAPEVRDERADAP
jgi:hypothetical protein